MKNESLLNFDETELIDIKHNQIEDTPINHFTIRWPYVAYAHKKYLMVVNAFDTNSVHRVVLS